MANNLSDRSRSVNKCTINRTIIPPAHASESPTGFTEADSVHEQTWQEKYQADSAHAYKNDKAEAYAFHRRRDHANIEAMQNLVIAKIAGQALQKFIEANPTVELPPDFTMPTNVRHLISALQGTHGGGIVVYEEFERSYLTIGAQLQFTGTDNAIKSRVRDWIDALDEWQFLVGVQLFVIRKGGALVYDEQGKQKFYPDGTAMRQKTKFIDYLKPRADEGMQRARVSEQWCGNEEKGIKAHPGLALADQIEGVIKTLPKLGSREESGAEKPPSVPQPMTEYADKQTQRLCDSAEKVADAIEKKDGDGDQWLEMLARSIAQRLVSRRKTRGASRDITTPPCVSSESPISEETQGGISYVTEEAVPVPRMSAIEPLPLPPGYSEVTRGFIGVSEDSVSEDEPPPPPVSPLPPLESRDTGGDAEAALQVFESVGVTEFQVTLKDELAGAALACETYTGACLRAFLPGLLKRNAERERAESIIVRPRKGGPGLIQADDLTGAEIEKVRHLAFLSAETSHQNFQAWFDVTDADETTRRRLLPALNADRGASGAMRLPGSRNMKPLRDGFPIRLVATAPGRQVCVADLERAGLLAPLPCPPQPTVERPRPMTRAMTRAPRFPDYARCLADKGDDHNRADAAFVKIAMCEGFTDSEAWAELERVAPREKLQRADYRRRTLSFCSAP